MRVAMVFPGQGTQMPGVGAPWQDDPAWKLLEQAEAALGEPLRSLVLDAPAEQLARTRDAQLAVLCTSLVAWEALRPLAHDIVGFAGHSLGQVTALVASGALDLEDGVRFAAQRAELTPQRVADEHPGRMAALLGATLEQAADACTAAPDSCWIANDNAPGQVVIAGTAEGVDAAITRAKAAGVKRATMLNVGGAFHTPLMQPAATGIAFALSDVHFLAPTAPVVANQDGAAYAGDDSWDSNGWRTRSADHVTLPVRWRTSMETLAALGADAFVEVGHGSMIAALAKRTVPDVPVFSCANPSDLDHLAEVLAS